jgi:integrase
VRSDYIFEEELSHILATLMPQNRLALEVSLYTGLRLSDVLSLKTESVKQRFTIQEQKTGKNRYVYLPRDLVTRMHMNAGKMYVFPHRLDGRKHRTRQAVWKDLNRAMKLFRIPSNLVISPHTCRKVYAVERFKRSGNLKEVQKLLNHSREGVTMLYAMADVLTERKLKRSKYSVLKK